MNLVKSFDYFDPTKVNGLCHIIGCGSVGSTVAENLVRLGVDKFALYDFDTVDSHNLVNQMFVKADIGRPKVEATADNILAINDEAKVKLYPEGYTNQNLNGYVFLCVDSIDLRREICQNQKMNRSIKLVIDFRTGLEEGQMYAANWGDMKQVENLLRSMDFTHEEAKDATPVTACGMALGVAPTVRAVCTAGVCNFVNFIKTGKLKTFAVINPFQWELIC